VKKRKTNTKEYRKRMTTKGAPRLSQDPGKKEKKKLLMGATRERNDRKRGSPRVTLTT